MADIGDAAVMATKGDCGENGILEGEDVGILPPHAPAMASCRSHTGLMRRGVIAAASALALAAGGLCLNKVTSVPTGQSVPTAEPPAHERIDVEHFLVAYQDDEGGVSYSTEPTTWTTTTSKPWREDKDDFPSLFCWLLAQTVGGQELNRVQGWWETKLVWQMYIQKVGLFACNEFAIFTDRRSIVSELGAWGWPYVSQNYTRKKGEILSWPLGSTQTAKNSDSSPSNTMIFTAAWKALGRSGRLEKHNWVVKQDPDALFLPWRLRRHTQRWPSKDGQMPMFILNCQSFNSMQGPLEIFSIGMVRAFLPQIDNCGAGSVGEDSKMQKCGQQFGQAVMDGTALEDKYCLHREPNCWSGEIIAYHPLKEIPSFDQCLYQTLKAEGQANHFQ